MSDEQRAAVRDLRERLTKELLLALTKVRIDNNKFGGLHYDVSDDALDDLIALYEQGCIEAQIKVHDDYWHMQRAVEERGIGPIALENKERLTTQLTKRGDNT